VAVNSVIGINDTNISSLIASYLLLHQRQAPQCMRIHESMQAFTLN